MLEYLKLRSTLKLLSADIERVIASQRPTDPNHKYFSTEEWRGLQSQLVHDWETVMDAVLGRPSRNEAEKALRSCVNGLIETKNDQLRNLKAGHLHGAYMWQAALWAYWSLYALLLHPDRQRDKAVASQAPELLIRLAQFLSLEKENRGTLGGIEMILESLPVVFGIIPRT